LAALAGPWEDTLAWHREALYAHVPEIRIA